MSKKSMLKGKLMVRDDYLIIDYDKPADVYFTYERSGGTRLAKLAFLGAIAALSNGDPVTEQALEKKLKIGRKSLGKLMGNLFLLDFDRFKILDGAENILDSNLFELDGNKISFDDSDADVYDADDWERSVSTLGELEASIADIAKYVKIDGKSLTAESFSLPRSKGGLGWQTAAVLLKICIHQGKLEPSIAVPFSSSPNGAGTTS